MYDILERVDKNSQRSYAQVTPQFIPLLDLSQMTYALVFIAPTQVTRIVNIVPTDLDWFVQRYPNKRAHWNAWESREYKGKLVLVP